VVTSDLAIETGPRETAIVYVDGFNLYKSALQKRFPHCKWLNIERLATVLLPGFDVVRVRYFTAEIKPRFDDPRVVSRQRAYLRALTTLQKTTVHLGHVHLRKAYFPLHPLRLDPVTSRTATVSVVHPEEKGSDVNLATRMLLDAFENAAHTYVLLSNDSDFVAPMTAIKHELRSNIGIIFPTENVSKRLLATGPSFTRHIREGSLVASQFPATLIDSEGRTIHKPRHWMN